MLPRYILRRANEAAAGHQIDPDLTWLLTPVGSSFLVNQQWDLQVKCSLCLSVSFCLCASLSLSLFVYLSLCLSLLVQG